MPGACLLTITKQRRFPDNTADETDERVLTLSGQDLRRNGIYGRSDS